MHERIAFVKTGWSDFYQGGPVVGRYAHITEFDEAHERFNFKRHSDGRYYGYIPPIGEKERPPQPTVRGGWLLIFVSARKGNGPLTVVGWYENATLHPEYVDRPEYISEEDFELDVHGSKFGYCISAKKAHLIPTALRTKTISGEHFKRVPILYVRGNGRNEAWRRRLAAVAESLLASSTVRTDRSSPSISFPDANHRRRVERAAINCAKSFLRKTCSVTDRQRENCGYDLLARHRKTRSEFHVEVKGTSTDLMHFYMTRGEFRYMPSPQWRLILVTNALSRPKLRFLTRREVVKLFDFEAFAWEASGK